MPGLGICCNAQRINPHSANHSRRKESRNRRIEVIQTVGNLFAVHRDVSPAVVAEGRRPLACKIRPSCTHVGDGVDDEAGSLELGPRSAGRLRRSGQATFTCSSSSWLGDGFRCKTKSSINILPSSPSNRRQTENSLRRSGMWRKTSSETILWHAGRDLQQPGQHVRRRLHGLAGDEPGPGDHRANGNTLTVTIERGGRAPIALALPTRPPASRPSRARRSSSASGPKR